MSGLRGAGQYAWGLLVLAVAAGVPLLLLTAALGPMLTGLPG